MEKYLFAAGALRAQGNKRLRLLQVRACIMRVCLCMCICACCLVMCVCLLACVCARTFSRVIFERLPQGTGSGGLPVNLQRQKQQMLKV